MHGAQVCAGLGVLEHGTFYAHLGPRVPMCAFLRDCQSRGMWHRARVSALMSPRVGSSAQQPSPWQQPGPRLGGRSLLRAGALPLDMNPPLSPLLREMLRARGCKAEQGAGSPGPSRPCSPASPLRALRPAPGPRRPCAPRPPGTSPRPARTEATEAAAAAAAPRDPRARPAEGPSPSRTRDAAPARSGCRLHLLSVPLPPPGCCPQPLTR